MNNSTLQALVSLIVGCIAIIFRDFFARKTIECQNNVGFNFGEKEIWITKIVIIIVSMGFIVFGVLDILKIIKFK